MRISLQEEPDSILGRLDPEGGPRRVAVGGKSFHESAPIVNRYFHQRALIHGNTSFSIAPCKFVASRSDLPIPKRLCSLQSFKIAYWRMAAFREKVIAIRFLLNKMTIIAASRSRMLVRGNHEEQSAPTSGCFA